MENDRIETDLSNIHTRLLNLEDIVRRITANHQANNQPLAEEISSRWTLDERKAVAERLIAHIVELTNCGYTATECAMRIYNLALEYVIFQSTEFLEVNRVWILRDARYGVSR